jgi:hypothetical protein
MVNLKPLKKLSLLLNADSLVDQFRHENDTWKRVLSFLTEENVILKNRLSEILQSKEECNNEFLEQVEYFQNYFLKQDEIIGFLRMEVSEQTVSLIEELLNNKEELKQVQKKQKQLREELENAERNFNKLKFEFNNYLSQTL